MPLLWYRHHITIRDTVAPQFIYCDAIYVAEAQAQAHTFDPKTSPAPLNSLQSKARTFTPGHIVIWQLVAWGH